MATQEELAPQFMRLFSLSGLLDEADREAYEAAHAKHKPILDVLTQEVSLGTFVDFFNSEITLQSRRLGRRAGSASLHEGLTATGMVNEEELKELLLTHQPPLAPLLEPLKDQGYLGAEAYQHALDGTADKSPEEVYPWIFNENLLSAQQICQWLSHMEADQMRQAALALALFILRHNGLLSKENFAKVQPMLSPERLDEVRNYVRADLGLQSKDILRKIEEDLTLPEVNLNSLPADAPQFAKFPQTLLRRQMM